MIKSLLIIVGVISFNAAIGQTNTTCADMAPICTDSILSFGVNANAPSSPVGNNYGCLGTQPNPSWFYFEVSQAGDINMELTASVDVDFIIWGPFNSLADAQGACGNLGNAPNPIGNVDCGFLGGSMGVYNEYPDIIGASVGEVYVMLITNFSNQVSTFSLSQIGGTGGTDCTIVTNCHSEPGTFSLEKNGLPTNAPIEICSGESFAILSAGDYSLPQDTIASIDGGDGVYSAQLMFLVYDALPSGPDPALDLGFTNVILPTDSLMDINAPGSPVIDHPLLGCGTYWLVPVAGDDGLGANGGILGVNDNGALHWDLDGNECYILGPPIEITYACDVTVVDQINCANGNEVDITVTGGGGTVNAINLGAGIISATTVTTPDVITLSGLDNNNNYNVLITDAASGCQQTVTGTFFTPQFVNVSLVAATSCQATATGSIFVEANPASGNGGLAEIIMDGNSETTTLPFDTLLAPPGNLVTITLVDQFGCTTDSLVTVPAIANHTIQIDVIALGTVGCFGACDGNATVNAYGVDANGVPDGIQIISITWTAPNGQTFTGASVGGMCQGVWTVTALDASGCENTIPVTVTSPSGLQLIVQSAAPPNCHGESNGSINLGIIGGTPGGSVFSWGHDPNLTSQTANSLSAGLYSASVEDINGCIATISHELVDPAAIDASFTTKNINCFGDSTGVINITDVFNLQPQGTNLSANINLANVEFYAWDLPGLDQHPLIIGNNGQPIYDSPVASNLPAGDYSVIIGDDNGCTNAFDFTLTENTELEDSTGTRPAYCRAEEFQVGNGVVYSSAFGGAGNWTYLWKNETTGATTNTTSWSGLNPGPYTITITDNVGCTLVKTITLDSVNPIAAFSVNSDQFTGPGEFEGTEIMDVTFSNESLNFVDPFDPFSDTTFKYSFYANDPDGAFWQFSYNYNEKLKTKYEGENEFDFCLVAQNFNDCQDSLCVRIVVHQISRLDVPNVFTPGADPNGEFYFPNDAIEEFDCTVYNRYGVPVFHFTSIDDRWNGNVMDTDKECQDGVYFFSYTGKSTDNTPYAGQGSVQLLRANK